MLISILLLNLIFFVWILLKSFLDTKNSAFKIGERVLIKSKYYESIYCSGGHIPFYGEVVAIRRNYKFNFNYDIIPNRGKKLNKISEDDMERPKRSDLLFPSIIRSLSELENIN